MDNAADEVMRLLHDARMANEAAARNADVLADLLLPNIRATGQYRLGKLKKALRAYNIHTGTWSD